MTAMGPRPGDRLPGDDLSGDRAPHDCLPGGLAPEERAGMTEGSLGGGAGEQSRDETAETTEGPLPGYGGAPYGGEMLGTDAVGGDTLGRGAPHDGPSGPLGAADPPGVAEGVDAGNTAGVPRTRLGDDPAASLPQAAPHGWDDGLIARRATPPAVVEADGGGPPTTTAPNDSDDSEPRAPGWARTQGRPDAAPPGPGSHHHHWGELDGGGSAFGVYDPHPRAAGTTKTLRPRLDALRELVGLSRSRLDRRALAEAGRVLDEAAARGRYSLGHTVVALAGATGSGKSTLFNALAQAPLSEAGVRRPTTAEPLACTWTDHADGLLDRLGIAPHARLRPADPYDAGLRGLVLLDLPDHDSAASGHRERVDRLLGLVDAVVWVLDPEKYADAVLHERYLRPLAGYAEVTFVVLNQVDRLPGDAADQVLDDLRRLLDEDGLALGEHGEPGATVLPVSALTGRGMGELRETLGRFVGECAAAERRLTADVDGATERLRPAYVADGGRAGLTEQARNDFEDRLADAAGAAAVGRTAERVWLREAGRACGRPWPRRRSEAKEPGGVATEPVAARPAVDEAVRALADEAATGLPAPWAQAVREAARRGAKGLPEAVDEAMGAAAPSGRLARPTWWTVAASLQVALLVVQVVAVGWLLTSVTGVFGGAWWLPALLLAAGVAGGPALAWGCALAARGPARAYGETVERRLRDAVAGCGRARVLEPVAAELLRYREVREKYAVAAGGVS